MNAIDTTQEIGRSNSTQTQEGTQEVNLVFVNDYDIHDLLSIGYAMSDALSAQSGVLNSANKVQSSCIGDFMRIKKSLNPNCPDGKFMTRFLLVANSYAHYIRSSRRKLEQDRALCKEKRAMALDLETKVSGRNALLRLSGQLFLIGGVFGIAFWFFIGKAQISQPGWHQVLMAIGGAMGSMVFVMAAQFTGMTNATRRIDLAYHLGLDRAKETQARSLKTGLTKAREDFARILEKRFGEADPRKLDITSELSIFESLRGQEDTHTEITFWGGLKLWLKRIFGWPTKEDAVKTV